MTIIARALGAVVQALEGVPVWASAEQVNAVLRRAPDYRYWRRWHYGTWRRAVRQAQAERARWCQWESRDPAPVRPLRRQAG